MVKYRVRNWEAVGSGLTFKGGKFLGERIFSTKEKAVKYWKKSQKKSIAWLDEI